MAERSKKKVLIIEDSSQDVILFEEYLRKSKYYDYTFETCDNAEEGLEKLINVDADCVLLDYRLNDDDGLNLIKKLKDKKFLRAPLVFMTAYATEEVINECLDLGAWIFIDKNKLTGENLDKAVYYAINNIYEESFNDIRSLC